MKTLINKVIKVIDFIKPTTYYYHDQVMTDDLERELMKAYAGTGFRGRRF